jgi:hypothetical protein
MNQITAKKPCVSQVSQPGHGQQIVLQIHEISSEPGRKLCFDGFTLFEDPVFLFQDIVRLV